MKSTQQLLYRGVLGFLLACILLGQGDGQTLAQAAVDDAIPAIVRIRGCNRNDCNVGLGSGALIHPSGVILTAYHVTLTDPNSPLSARHNDFVIELTEGARSVPEARYRAQLIAANVNDDLALLRIYQDERTGQSITPTSGLNLPFLPLADVDTVRIGETLHVLGYPQAGGARVNYTDESLSGFDGDNGSLLKIQKALSEGNSGGPALVVRDGEYQIVGVVIRRRGEVGEISLMRTVDQLRDLAWEPQVYQVWADAIALQIQTTDDGPMVRVDMTLHMLDFVGSEGQLLVYGFTTNRRPLPVANGNATGAMAPQVVFGEPFTGQAPVESQRYGVQIPLSALSAPPEQVRWQIMLWDVDRGQLLWEGQEWLQAAPFAVAEAQTVAPTNTAQPTATVTPLPIPTSTNTPQLTETPIPQPTATETARFTATPTNTPLPMVTHTDTVQPTDTATTQPTATEAPVLSATSVRQSGGVLTVAINADASVLNPILHSDSISKSVTRYIFPILIGIDPNTGSLVPTEMAQKWDVSADGLVWTFHLRDDVFWSDGETVNAFDFKFTYDAIASDLFETPHKSLVDLIHSIDVPDPLTIIVTFADVKCDSLGDLGLGWLPSHLYADDFTDIVDNPLNEAPKVSAGPFIFQSWTRYDDIILTRNDSYFLGAPYVDGIVYKIISDPGTQLAALKSREISVLSLEPSQLYSVQGDPNIDVFNFKDDGYDYIALNLANPDNPMPGRDRDDNMIEQDPHPILSDINVRRAIAHSLDYAAIIEQVYLGQGYQIASNVLPAVSWAHDPSIEPYAYDIEMAKQLLTEAGWIDRNGDGVREKNGEILTLKLVTNAGNRTRENLGVLVKNHLEASGFQINFEAIEFGTLVGQMLGQTYDMVVIGWTGMGADPNDDSFWMSKFDTPDSGFNFVSYHNAQIDELLRQGVSVPGCNPEERAPYYKEIQQIIHDDLPYIFISGSVDNVAYETKWGGLNPGPWNFYHNIEQWYLLSSQR